MKRLVLFVEGEGDEQAAPTLIGGMLGSLPPQLAGQLGIHRSVFTIGGLTRVTGKRSSDFLRFLNRALRCGNVGAILVLLDGDQDFVEGTPFCPPAAARLLASRAKTAGAGAVFSFASVFFRQEYEAILIAVANQFGELKQGVPIPDNIETRRNAKGWLEKNLVTGYRSTSDQLRLTRKVTNWEPARALSCFQRLERAVRELATAVANNQHIATPV